jgi:hypothetical protein
MFLLRWCYDYPGRTIHGLWSNPGDNEANKAWANFKEGLVCARIEMKDIRTKEITTVAECSGQNFRMFQWIGAARYHGVGTQRTSIAGIKLLTHDKAHVVYVDGTRQVSELGEAEKNLNFRIYGK